MVLTLQPEITLESVVTGRRDTKLNALMAITTKRTHQETNRSVISALGVYDFQKRSSIINCSAEGAQNLAVTAAELARNEHLQAHALSAEYRLRKNSD